MIFQYLSRQILFSRTFQQSPLNSSTFQACANPVLTDLYDEGLSYSAINTAKSIMSSVFEIIHKRDIGKEVLIRRFMKGIFHLQPVFPKTNFHLGCESGVKIPQLIGR